MLQRITNQPNQTQPPSLILLPSPNLKGGINVIHSKEAEGEEDENEEGSVSWWYDLLAQLVDSDDEEDEESKDESEEEDEDENAEEDSEDEFVKEEDQTEEEESVNKKRKKDEEENHNNERTSIIATLFNDKEIKEEVPVKCEDPGPCLVTCKINGVEVRECLCDSGAYSSVMPYKLYKFLKLGPLKKTKEIFTITDAREKGGMPQVLLGRSFLKTAEFKLIYYDEIFTFSVGTAIEIFHLTQPPKPRKKSLHQLQESKGKKAPRGEKKAAAKMIEKETTYKRRKCSENS
ncbi:hypothetical protein PIB30_079044 [Stylosanthes scabra]|uniref:Uncharacterized protein n=1 Tax=Stylosanthes scabra TaxID=79078 RepID=A0ABU6SR59_9FABA|nr:hypothetical protein [Stylosanthes scabra]